MQDKSLRRACLFITHSDPLNRKRVSMKHKPLRRAYVCIKTRVYATKNHCIARVHL